MTFIQNSSRAFTISGFLTPLLAIDVGILLSLLFVVKSLIAPAFSSYRRAKLLDRLAGAAPRHWFYGHGLEDTASEAGIMRRVKRLFSHAVMYNQWFAPFMSILQLHHTDTAVSLLSSGAPKYDLYYGFMRPWIGDGLLTSSGRKWQRNRHLLTPAFHFSILKGYTEVFNSCSKIMLEKWQKVLDRPIEVFSDVSLMTLDTMLKCSMSSDTDCQHIKGEHPYIDAIHEMSNLILIRVKKPHLLPDFIFWRTKEGKRFKAAMDVVHDHAERIIAERRVHLSKSMRASGNRQSGELKADDFSPSGKQRLDFLDILLQTRDQDGEGLSDREIRDEVDTFLFEGHDTTASGIAWALYNLAKYPQFQERCREEVLTILAGKADVEWSDFSKMQNLTMFIKESMRLYPPVYSISRKLEEPLTLRSTLNTLYESVIPKGTAVGLHIFSLHRHHLLWEDPEVFKPERFTKDNIAKRNPHSYLPFSAGSRNCIGQNFAMNEIKTVLAQALRRYRLHLNDATPEPELAPLLTLQSKSGIFIKFQQLVENENQ